eukprot:CAMPEP_0206303950 /NCGR_PEP_ID=MMETSP0106_2-20121207/9497_1 /ASSEMBLY_ACC=CAM_ASM_000206 /TAXON_ID=81532 /ORGANISM="Acanthoeca-like sp., Strain 10tr" /LENGTH=411 /DNA_ID=CAMNT_0053734753 /DNA_START=402 /DNA_END=1638 /DNA_ORIENTATION=-
MGRVGDARASAIDGGLAHDRPDNRRAAETSFFAVYDGHAGKTVSMIASTDLLPFITQELVESDQQKVAALDPATIGKAMRKGTMAFDAQMFAKVDALRTLQDVSGSTAIMSMVTPRHVILANVGDSRAVLGGGGRPVYWTEDHKPQQHVETTRVIEAGGYIVMGRVCGNLAVSRALGDFMYKEVRSLPPERQKISNYADITCVERTEAHDFLIVACDGIWDVVTNQQAVSFVNRLWKNGDPAEVVAEKLLDHCLRRGSTDNMSALIIYFRSADRRKASAKPRRFARQSRTVSGGSTTSVDSEGEIVPKKVDPSRGRGSVSELEPLTEDVSPPAPAAAAAAPAAAAGGGDEDEVGDEEDDEEDIVPMKTDLSRGRGSFILTEDEAKSKRTAIEAACAAMASPDDELATKTPV